MNSKKIVKIIICSIVALISGIVLYFIVGFLFLIWGGGSCGNQTVFETYSDNKSYQAIYYLRDCGATTNFSSQVKLVRVKDKRLFSINEEVVFITGHDKDVKLKWNDNILNITYSGNDQIFKQLNAWQDIKIEYIPINVEGK